jgi:hypothetical protein
MKKVTRRDALKTVAVAGAATGALSAAACKKPEAGSAMETKHSKKQDADVITAVTPLSFPWQTILPPQRKTINTVSNHRSNYKVVIAI